MNVMNTLLPRSWWSFAYMEPAHDPRHKRLKKVDWNWISRYVRYLFLFFNWCLTVCILFINLIGFQKFRLIGNVVQRKIQEREAFQLKQNFCCISFLDSFGAHKRRTNLQVIIKFSLYINTQGTNNKII